MEQRDWGVLGVPAIGICGISFMLILNGFAVGRYLRRGSEETATALSRMGWALSVFGYCLGPCGIITSIAVWVISSIERGKVSREEASAWTLVPCQAMRTNVVLTILVMLAQLIYGVAVRSPF